MSRILVGSNQITQSYSDHRGWSKGVDIVKYKNQVAKIIAHSDGEVVKVVDYMTGTNKQLDREGVGYGNYVMILHEGKYQNKYVVTNYVHLASVAEGIKEGVKLSGSKVIGSMGNTGNSHGSHLHFEIRLYHELPEAGTINDVSKFIWIDPTPYIDSDLPTDNVPAVGYLDAVDYQKGRIVCHGWAYKNGGSNNVQIKVYNRGNVAAVVEGVGDKARPDVKAAMKYNTDKVGYQIDESIYLKDGIYEVKAFVGDDQLANTKSITVKNELTASSYPNYEAGTNQYYRVRLSFANRASSKGSFRVWEGAFKTWKAYESAGYHIFDNSGNQLD